MIAHVHDNRFGTFCIELPNKEFLEFIFKEHATTTLLNIGYSKLHPKDRFVKSIGRQVSYSKINSQLVHLTSIEIKGTKHVYNFYFNNKDRKYSFGLSTIKESDVVKLIYSETRSNFAQR